MGKQIGFPEIASSFVESRVDGDLLLQLTEDNLRDDIGLINGIKRKRFTRELQQLKKMADYSSRDAANINTFLQILGPEFSIYTYSFLNAGVEKKDYLRNISEDQLLNECGIKNSIHRYRIMDGIRQLENGLVNGLNEENNDKSLDVFVSYRRSNGSQLASLLKVHLQLRGFSVFIDVERLEAGKFDNNLLQSIQKAKHFLLVLTPNALDRCVDDHERKDWVHREICAALSANCNIIPIIDNFIFPETDTLPEDMRQVCHFNAVRWIHDYQDACVDKLERFMRGETNPRCGDNLLNRVGLKGDITPGTPSNPSLMAPLPRLRLHHCQVPFFRFCKANSPSRNWIINSNKFAHHGGLPPQYPYFRRGSNTPISSLALTSHPPTPNRSRSLDGLLDQEPIRAACEATINEQVPSHATTKSCDEIDKDFCEDIDKDFCDENETESSLNKSRSIDNNLDSDIDKCSIYSSSSDSKRKRNFMDRCVNKVRSLIKK
ncbi:hypothetical protein JTB14_005140 [Gonioctena quinquepunctata]|nr:hypothetical protein JTB14_005140 [Gonioctena quinquepunctata]